MTAGMQQRQQVIAWSVASRPIPGLAVSGDLHVVAPTPDGAVIAVMDGLGHGEEATNAARIAALVVEQHAGEPVEEIFQHCHRALRQSRGVVMTLVAVNTFDSAATVLGVGNVETVVVRADPRARTRRESVLLRNGVVGYQLPVLRSSRIELAVGDVMVFATDGVQADFADLVTTVETPAELAEKILTRKFRGTDDGLVLACKYRGKP